MPSPSTSRVSRPAGSVAIPLRSEEAQDIISRPPAWLVRWGISLFGLLLLLLLLAGWLIHYPDLVRAPFRLTTANAPKPVTARADGKLVRLFVTDGTRVHRGAPLAYLESTAHHDQVLALGAHLDTLAAWMQAGRVESLGTLSPPDYSHLGELQPAYETYYQAYTELLSFLADGYYVARKSMLQSELDDLKRLEANLKEQQSILEQDYRLAEQEYRVQQQLAAEKVIAPAELKREESKLLARRMPVKQLGSALITNHADQSAKRKELFELDKLIREQKSRFVQSLHTLRSATENWKRQFVLTAPVDGRVRFAALVEENQPVAPREEVFYVEPDSRHYVGELRVPQYNLGKIKPGQRVFIKFAGYPSEEFGSVEGTIATLSQVPGRDSTFLAKVHLPAGLRTQYGKPIVYRSGIQATGEIVTEDLRLLERLLYQLRKALAR